MRLRSIFVLASTLHLGCSAAAQTIPAPVASSGNGVAPAIILDGVPDYGCLGQVALGLSIGLFPGGPEIPVPEQRVPVTWAGDRCEVRLPGFSCSAVWCPLKVKRVSVGDPGRERTFDLQRSWLEHGFRPTVRLEGPSMGVRVADQNGDEIGGATVDLSLEVPIPGKQGDVRTIPLGARPIVAGQGKVQLPPLVSPASVRVVLHLHPKDPEDYDEAVGTPFRQTLDYDQILRASTTSVAWSLPGRVVERRLQAVEHFSSTGGTFAFGGTLVLSKRSSGAIAPPSLGSSRIDGGVVNEFRYGDIVEVRPQDGHRYRIRGLSVDGVPLDVERLRSPTAPLLAFPWPRRSPASPSNGQGESVRAPGVLWIEVEDLGRPRFVPYRLDIANGCQGGQVPPASRLRLVWPGSPPTNEEPIRDVGAPEFPREAFLDATARLLHVVEDDRSRRGPGARLLINEAGFEPEVRLDDKLRVVDLAWATHRAEVAVIVSMGNAFLEFREAIVAGLRPLDGAWLDASDPYGAFSLAFSLDGKEAAPKPKDPGRTVYRGDERRDLSRRFEERLALWAEPSYLSDFVWKPAREQLARFPAVLPSGSPAHRLLVIVRDRADFNEGQVAKDAGVLLAANPNLRLRLTLALVSLDGQCPESAITSRMEVPFVRTSSGSGAWRVICVPAGEIGRLIHTEGTGGCHEHD